MQAVLGNVQPNPSSMAAPRLSSIPQRRCKSPARYQSPVLQSHTWHHTYPFVIQPASSGGGINDGGGSAGGGGGVQRTALVGAAENNVRGASVKYNATQYSAGREKMGEEATLECEIAIGM